MLPYRLSDEPFEWVLWTYQQLREVEAMERIVRDSDRVTTASLTASATWAPKNLQAEERRIERERQLHNQRAEGKELMPVKDFRAWMMEHAARIAAGRVLSPEAVTAVGE